MNLIIRLKIVFKVYKTAVACIASAKGKGKRGGGGEKKRKKATAEERRHIARITPCFYVQNLDVKC